MLFAVIASCYLSYVSVHTVGTTEVVTTTAPPTTLAVSPSDGGLSAGAIVGIAIGGALALLIIVIIIVVVISKCKNKSKVGVSQEEMALQEQGEH